MSYFYVQLGDKKLQLFHPGRIAFVTDVTSTSELAVLDAEGRQQNGTIFSINSTLLYAKILARLAINYNTKAQEIGLGPDMALS